MTGKQQHITLLTTNALGFIPFVFHKAIRFQSTDGQTLIIHLTTSGPELVNYDNFLTQRTVYKEKDIPVIHPFDPYDIMQNEKNQFDWMNNNCEDFTSRIEKQVTGKECLLHSPQRTFWICFLAIILILLVTLR